MDFFGVWIMSGWFSKGQTRALVLTIQNPEVFEHNGGCFVQFSNGLDNFGYHIVFPFYYQTNGLIIKGSTLEVEPPDMPRSWNAQGSQSCPLFNCCLEKWTTPLFKWYTEGEGSE